MSASYVIRYMADITQRMIAYVAGTSQGQTDFTVGSRIRTFLEASAQELEELYYQLWNGLQSSAQSAIYDGFQFPALPASPASGTVTFGRAVAAGQDYIIPAGTTVATRGSSSAPSLQFVTVAAVTLAAGQTSVNATVQAAQPGSASNVVAGAVSYIVSSVSGIETVTNAAGFSNGNDAETDSQRAERFEHRAELQPDRLPDRTAQAERDAALSQRIDELRRRKSEQIGNKYSTEPFQVY